MLFGKHIEELHRLTDAELFARLRQGRSEAEAAFKELYRRHAARVRAYCHKVLDRHEDADDVFQETFIRLHASARQERTMTNVVGFIFRIARNLCLNVKRRRTSGEPLDGLELSEGFEASLENGELLRLIACAVERLDLHLREAFVLRDYENFSYEEIAALLDTTIPTVKSRVRRARKKVRAILAPNISELD